MDKPASPPGLLRAVTLALRDAAAAFRSAVPSALAQFRALDTAGHVSCSEDDTGVDIVANRMACRYCYSEELRRSRARWYDPVMRFVLPGRSPFRCLACRWRQWRRVD